MERGAPTPPNASSAASAARARSPPCSAGARAPSSTGPTTGRIPAQWHAAPDVARAPERCHLGSKRLRRTPSPTRSRPPAASLGVLLVGLGAVATTFIAGVEHARRGLGQPIGSLTQMGTIRLGKRTENRSPLIKDFVPLAGLDDLVFGAWDPSRTTPTRPRSSAACSTATSTSSRSPTSSRRSSRCPPSSTSTTSSASTARTSRRRRPRWSWPKQIRAGHPRLQGDEQLRPPRHGLVRLHRDLHRGRRRPPEPRSASRRRMEDERRDASPRRCSTPTPPSWRACPSPTAPRTSRSTSRRW